MRVPAGVHLLRLTHAREMTTSSRYFRSWEEEERRRSQEEQDALPEIPTATCLTLDSTEATIRSEAFARALRQASLEGQVATYVALSQQLPMPHLAPLYIVHHQQPQQHHNKAHNEANTHQGGYLGCSRHRPLRRALQGEGGEALLRAGNDDVAGPSSSRHMFVHPPLVELPRGSHREEAEGQFHYFFVSRPCPCQSLLSLAAGRGHVSLLQQMVADLNFYATVATASHTLTLNSPVADAFSSTGPASLSLEWWWVGVGGPVAWREAVLGAATHNHVAALKYLLSTNLAPPRPHGTQCRGSERWVLLRALGCACACACEGVVRYLLTEALPRHEALNTPLPDGSTPLAQALQHGHLGLARVLVELGADVRRWGDSLVHKVVIQWRAHQDKKDKQWGHRHRQAQLQALHWLVEEQHVGVDGREGGSGMTPLMHACGSGQGEVVKGLLGHGAEGSLRDHMGATALHHAAKGGHVECIHLLVQAAGRGGRRRGLSIEMDGEDDEVIEAREDSTGATPLHLAVTHRHAAAVAYLVHTAHARVLLRDSRGLSAIDLAARAGMQDMVAFLTRYVPVPSNNKPHSPNPVPPQYTHDSQRTAQAPSIVSPVTWGHREPRTALRKHRYKLWAVRGLLVGPAVSAARRRTTLHHQPVSPPLPPASASASATAVQGLPRPSTSAKSSSIKRAEALITARRRRSSLVALPPYAYGARGGGGGGARGQQAQLLNAFHTWPANINNNFRPPRA